MNEVAPGGLTRRGVLLSGAAAGLFAALSVASSANAEDVVWGHPFDHRRNFNWGYGMRQRSDGSWAMHHGMDYPMNGGSRPMVRSVADGVVFDRGWHGNFGNFVEIRHANGWSSYYAHLYQAPTLSGQVSRGQAVGLMGNTGAASFGDHLHIELRTTPGVWNRTTDPKPHIHGAPLPGEQAPPAPPQEEDDMFNEDDRALLRNAAAPRKPFIRIQATNRGIALISANYFRGLAPSELDASARLMSEHINLSDADFDIYKAIAIGGETSERGAIRTEARPLKLYRFKGNLIVIGPGGKQWDVPSEAYRVLLQAVGLVGDITRDLGTAENELAFIKQILGSVSPDPATSQQTASVLGIPSADAEKLAMTIESERNALAVNA